MMPSLLRIKTNLRGLLIKKLPGISTGSLFIHKALMSLNKTTDSSSLQYSDS
jgi:hypothetical protein